MNRLVPASISLMMLLAFCPMTTAFADKPKIVFIPVDDTFTDSSCGFDVVNHIEGTVKLTFSPDNPDFLLAEGDHLHWSLTNPANGKSLTFPVAQTLKVQLVEDGTSVLAVFTGLSIQVTVPGQGRVITQTGRIVFEFPCLDLNCSPTRVVFFAGQHDVDFTPICDYLADP
jgi:hypothetical protein